MKLLPVKTNKDSSYIRTVSNAIKGNLALAKRREERKERGRDEEIIKRARTKDKSMAVRNLTLLLLAAASDAFSRPTTINTVSRFSASPIKIPKISNVPPRSSCRAVTTLQASSNGITPYYEVLMERMPSKKVLEVVDKARGTPIVASGELFQVFCVQSFRIIYTTVLIAIYFQTWLPKQVYRSPKHAKISRR